MQIMEVGFGENAILEVNHMQKLFSSIKVKLF